MCRAGLKVGGVVSSSAGFWQGVLVVSGGEAGRCPGEPRGVVGGVKAKGKERND